MISGEPYPNLVNSINRQELKQSYIKQQAELENQDRNKRIPKKHNVFRIMTYNVYGFNFFKNSASEIKKIIDILDPDIINFQEFNNGFNIDGGPRRARGRRRPPRRGFHRQLLKDHLLIQHH